MYRKLFYSLLLLVAGQSFGLVLDLGLNQGSVNTLTVVEQSIEGVSVVAFENEGPILGNRIQLVFPEIYAYESVSISTGWSVQTNAALAGERSVTFFYETLGEGANFFAFSTPFEVQFSLSGGEGAGVTTARLESYLSAVVSGSSIVSVFSNDEIEVQTRPVPEPHATSLWLGLCVVLLVGCRRRI